MSTPLWQPSQQEIEKTLLTHDHTSPKQQVPPSILKPADDHQSRSKHPHTKTVDPK